MPAQKHNFTEFDKKHFETIEQYIRRLKRIYNKTVEDIATAAATTLPIAGQVFTFEQSVSLRQYADAIFRAMAQQIVSLITAGESESWLISAAKNDDLVKSVLSTTKLTEEQLSGFMRRNLEALSSFQNRKVDGRGLSERVWNQTLQFKNELELGLDLTLGEGRSAASLARDLKKNLNEPERLFRRVRDKYGNLNLSKAAQAYNPGQGVYRSSFKNAMRTARTEINMAYRTSDHERWQQLDFVVGYEVKRSNNITQCDICEPLKGKYPKTFKFASWHPGCRCFVVSILASGEELNQMEQRILNGESTAFDSKNAIKDVPAGYKQWISKNNDRILRGRSVPYFIRDNPGFSGLRVG